MKRTKPTQKKPTPEDLLKKLRQLDDAQMGAVHGGDRCYSRCHGGHEKCD